MAGAIAQRGYRRTTVADVVRIARTSRRTFYEHFTDREACFLALFEQTTQQIIGEVARAASPALPWEDQVDNALGAYAASVIAQPALHESFVRELPGLSQAGAEQQRVVIERFARLLIDLVESSRHQQPQMEARPLPSDVAIIIVGGLRELLVISMQQGRDLHEVNRGAAQVIKAILAATVL
ncbi:MAG: TetR/AcrR family transcriptional regulator [Solirubrobacteraceae bacterium]